MRPNLKGKNYCLTNYNHERIGKRDVAISVTYLHKLVKVNVPSCELISFFIIVGKQLMLRVAELVPRHPGRVKKQEPVATSTAGPSKSSKGGKKKR